MAPIRQGRGAEVDEARVAEACLVEFVLGVWETPSRFLLQVLPAYGAHLMEGLLARRCWRGQKNQAHGHPCQMCCGVRFLAGAAAEV